MLLLRVHHMQQWQCECCLRVHHMLLLLLLLLQVRLHTDKATGKSRGYAHVHFADEAGLNRCAGSDINK
jgi:RNA recognition motif-containing protein